MSMFTDIGWRPRGESDSHRRQGPERLVEDRPKLASSGLATIIPSMESSCVMSSIGKCGKRCTCVNDTKTYENVSRSQGLADHYTSVRLRPTSVRGQSGTAVNAATGFR